jgi:hypothetical protein
LMGINVRIAKAASGAAILECQNRLPSTCKRLNRKEVVVFQSQTAYTEGEVVSSMAPTTDRQALQAKVLQYFGQARTGARISKVAQRLRKAHQWKSLRDADIKAVVLPMVMSGMLKYTPELKLTIGGAKKRLATAKAARRSR